MRPEILQRVWKKTGENPENIIFQRVHETAMQQWRKEGEPLKLPEEPQLST